MGLVVVMSCDVARIVRDKYQGYTAAVAKLFLFFRLLIQSTNRQCRQVVLGLLGLIGLMVVLVLLGL
jgi:hypothetical protein